MTALVAGILLGGFFVHVGYWLTGKWEARSQATRQEILQRFLDRHPIGQPLPEDIRYKEEREARGERYVDDVGWVDVDGNVLEPALTADEWRRIFRH